jgi:hypothetical protein
MLHEVVVGIKFWNQLIKIDEGIAAKVAARGCPKCGGRLHRGDYLRKPRGGLIALALEGEVRRISLCCEREGCRKRATPPSVRFLGRKVYVGAAIVIASVILRVSATVGAAQKASGMAVRTMRRWSCWWRMGYAKSEHFEAARSHFVTPVQADELPGSLWRRFIRRANGDLLGLRQLLGFLAPVTTQTVADGSRFVRVE